MRETDSKRYKRKGIETQREREERHRETDR